MTATSSATTNNAASPFSASPFSPPPFSPPANGATEDSGATLAAVQALIKGAEIGSASATDSADTLSFVRSALARSQPPLDAVPIMGTPVEGTPVAAAALGSPPLQGLPLAPVSGAALASLASPVLQGPPLQGPHVQGPHLQGPHVQGPLQGGDTDGRLPASVGRLPASDHEVAVRASLWLDEKPAAVAFDSHGDGASLLVCGEQPPTHAISTGYLWAQTLSEVGVCVLLPAGTRARSVSCTFKRTRLRIALLSPPRLLLDCELLCPIVPDGSSWTIEPARGGGGSGPTLQATLEKVTRGGFWRCVSDGHDSVKIPEKWPMAV